MALKIQTRLRRLQRRMWKSKQRIRELEFQCDSLQKQVSRAAQATGELGAHSRACEVALAAERLNKRGIQIFGGPGSRLGGAMEMPPISDSTSKLIDSQIAPQITQ